MDAVVNDAPLVDLSHSHRGDVNQRDVGKIECPQLLVVEGRALAAVGLIRLEGGGGLGAWAPRRAVVGGRVGRTACGPGPRECTR